MNREDLKALATERAKTVDVEAAWTRVQPSSRRARRKPAVLIAMTAAALAAVIAIGGALVAVVFVTDGDGERGTASSETRSSTSTTSGTRPPDPSPQAPPAPEFPQGTFQALLDRAPSDPDGTRHVSITLPDGQRVPVSVAPQGLDMVGAMSFSETVYVSCPGGPSCGDAQPKAYPTEELPPGNILGTFTGGDGEPVLLVEHPLGLALRWVRSGWTIDVPLPNIPEPEHQRWISGLVPFVDDQGWVQLRTSNGLALGVGGGLNPKASLYIGSGREAIVDFVTGTTCTPANDTDTLLGDRLYASRCIPGSGVLMNAQGTPGAVQFLLSVLSVG